MRCHDQFVFSDVRILVEQALADNMESVD